MLSYTAEQIIASSRWPTVWAWSASSLYVEQTMKDNNYGQAWLAAFWLNTTEYIIEII